MFGLLKNLQGRGGGKGTASPIETFGDARIARGLGEEILQASLERMNCVQVIRDRLTAMTRFQKDDLVDRLFARLALFVFDLPASEANHHSERFGLLDHLLDVAKRTAQALTGAGFQVSPEPSVHHREGPLWAYAGVIAAIAHDIGKPLDLDVVAPGGSTAWDPRREPLRLFCERHQMSGTSPELWHFHKGRGMSSHERHIATLLPKVITPEMEAYLGPRLPSVLRALSPDENWNRAEDLSATAQEVVKVVRRIDKVTSIADHEARHPKAEKPAQGAPSAPQATVLPFPPPITVAAPRTVTREEGEVGRPVILAPVQEGPIPDLGFIPVLRAIPSDFHAMKVRKHGKRRGDPVETAGRISSLLHPAKFEGHLKRMLVAKRFARNGLYSHAYLRPDYLWLLVPEAFEVFARIHGIPFDAETVAMMTESLRSSSNVIPSSPDHATEFIKTRPDAPSMEAVRLKSRPFLSESDIESLGFHEFEIKVWSPAGRWEAPR